ncbi:MAG: hypothetical protein ABW221_00170 [Vicinamibacteria bacterium]
MRRLAALALCLLALAAGPARTQDAADEPAPDPSELLDALLATLGGFKEMTPAELEREVAELGGVPFRRPVPFEFMERPALGRYVHEILDAEYGPEKARADARTLEAFGLLPAGTDLRAARARLLEQNVAGFYDMRPGRKRMYAISARQTLTPANQMVLSHELRHALQDQYANIDTLLPKSVGDFDDRSFALVSLLEGDAILVMERFLKKRLPGGEDSAFDPSGFTTPVAAMLPDAPPVLRDQLVLPYAAGRSFAAAVFQRGGWPALRAAWTAAPQSSEQVLHPEKYFAREAPRVVDPGPAPAGGTLLQQGVLGEAFVGTLLGEGSETARAGWGGDAFRTWDLGGRTLLAWRSAWDSPADAREFQEAFAAVLRRRGVAQPDRHGFHVQHAAPWTLAWRHEADGGVTLLAADAVAVVEAAMKARASSAK